MTVWVVRVHASVTLIDFRATAQASSILIEWETATELDTSGFYIQRSTQSTAGYQRISPYIPSAAIGIVGAQYQYNDDTASAGIIYYYRLEAISNGGISELYDPVPGSWGSSNGTPTTTSTLSATRTPTASGTARTQTPTSTGITRTATNTPPASSTPIPTRTTTSIVIGVTSTPTPIQTGILPGPTGTLEGTVFASPTSTLLPLPSITLIFPVLTPTQTPTVTQTGTLAATATPTDTPEPPTEPLPTRWKVLAMLLVVLWILLAFFLTFLIRRMSPS